MRLIDADALMKYCLNQKSKTIDCNEIARFPTAQPQTGHWIVTDEAGHAKCSECGASMDLGGGDYHNYCPNCGARMVAE